MGCGASLVSRVATAAPGPGYGQGPVPKYRDFKKSAKKHVAIIWDMDDVLCPPDALRCQQFIEGLRQEFIASNRRIEVAISGLFDSGSVLNMSEDIQELHEFMKTELGVSVMGSQGPAALLANLEIQRFCTMAQKKSTLVIIGGVLDFHEPCFKARKHGIFVERLFGTVAPRRMVAGSCANWCGSLPEFLKHIGMADWRIGGNERAAIRFKSGISDFHARMSRARSDVDSDSASNLDHVLSYEDQAPQSWLGSAQAAPANSPRASPAPPSNAHGMKAIVEEVEGGEGPAPDEESPLVAAAVDDKVATETAAGDAATGSTPATDGAASGTATAAGQTTEATADTDSPPCAPQPRGSRVRSSVKFDAAEVSADDGGGTGRPTLTARRSIASSLSASMGKSRNRAAVSDAEADDIVSLMDTASMAAAVQDEDGGEDAGGSHEGGSNGANIMVAAPDPVLAWKAAALRALRESDDGAMTIAALAAYAPNPEPGSSYVAHLQTHLVDRLLARWVVEGESIQLMSASPVATNSASEDEVAAGHSVDQIDDVAGQSNSAEVEAAPSMGDRFTVRPDPMLAWKADVLRALRSAEGSKLAVAELVQIAPNPDDGVEYTEQLQTYLVDRSLAEWTDGAQSIHLASPWRTSQQQCFAVP